MTSRYRSSAVPVIVIGNDEKVLKGFVVEAFQMAVRDVIAKRR
jgi:glutaredoxin 3